VYWADLGYGDKPFLCVSNNSRNQRLDSFLAVRITTSRKPPLDSVVPLGSNDGGFTGNVLCDDLVEIGHDEIKREGGALSLPTMMRVDTGLKVALALR
jgi:mRNA interferase MazF